jgi:hypothetical protein
MNKYIIDGDGGNINFYEELMKDEDDADANDVNDANANQKTVCLLTGLPLVKNHIKLSCSHTFNYEALFNEVISQKKYNEFDTQYINIYDIKCPYCRNITHNLLPYIPSIKKDKINGVNHPERYTMNHKTCMYIFMRGKNKGTACNQSGFETDYGDLCERHWKSSVAKAKVEPTSATSTATTLKTKRIRTKPKVTADAVADANVSQSHTQ